MIVVCSIKIAHRVALSDPFSNFRINPNQDDVLMANLFVGQSLFECLTKVSSSDVPIFSLLVRSSCWAQQLNEPRRPESLAQGLP